MTLTSPCQGDSYEVPELPIRPTKWRRGMKEGPGESLADMQLGDLKPWRVGRAEAGDVSIIWLRKPTWANSAHSPEYVATNVAAHEKILAAQARVMGVGAIWVRGPLHSTAEALVFSEGRFDTIEIPAAAPRILVYAGKDASRVHWAGWLNCVEKYDPKGRPTGIPLRVESPWNPKVPQGEFWAQGPHDGRDGGSAFEEGVVYREGYLPEILNGTHLETILRSDFKPAVATERYTPSPAVLRTRSLPQRQRR